MPRLFRLHRVFLGAAAATLLACADKEAMSPRPNSELSATSAALPAGEFNILTTAEDDQGFNSASDGTNYLVGLTVGDFPDRFIKTRVVFANGTLGPLTNTFRKGDPPMVVFDGTNYFVVWNDRTPPSPGCSPQPCVPPPPPVNIYGIFISPAGAKVGGVKKISTENTGLSLGGVALAGGQFLVTYSVYDISSQTVKLYGRFVTAAGVAGARFLLASPQSTGSLNNVVTDGTNFLVGWIAGANHEVVRTRLVHGNGSLDAPVTVDGSAASSVMPIGMAYNNGVYFITWSDSIALHQWNVYGRVLSQAGVPSGNRFTIDASTGNQIGGGVTASGSNFFATWINLAPDPADSKSRGKFFTATGTPVGTPKTLFLTDPGTGKMPIVPAPREAQGSSFFFVVPRALPGSDPQDFSLLNTWDLSASIKTLTP